MQDFRMETFLTVCQYMNFTRAAETLNMTQSAVSQHIKFLETAYGVRLFTTSGKKLLLTEAGKILQQAAIALRHDEQHLRDRLQQSQSDKEKYRFGATLSVAEFMVPKNLEHFLSNHPHSHVRMAVANTKELLAKLTTGELDFAIVEGFFPKLEYEFLPYREEGFVAVASPAKARLYQGKPLHSLLQENLFLREAGSGTREILERALEEKGMAVTDFANLIELGNIGAIKHMLMANLGITFCYYSAVDEEVQRGELAVINLKDWHLRHEIDFIFLKDSIFRDDYVKIYQELCK